MKIVQINTVCGSGSTGKICLAVSRLLTLKGIENYILYASGTSDHPEGICYMTPMEVKLQALRSRLLGNYGFNSVAATKRLLKELDRIKPDVVHLHNLHGHNVHLEMLFSYLRERKVKVFWTFHDCWAFTGYCPHYDMIGCQSWKTGCGKCPQRKHYSWLLDRSSALYERKKGIFNDVDLTVITPSEWLAQQVGQSFLKDVTVKVIRNGIDLSVFYPRESDFRVKYGLENKYIVLGVAHIWCEQKGLDVFIELSKRLSERFKIVLVGTNDEIDAQLPENIISIHRTQNQAELAEIYTAADVFVNPTREENYPTTHMESLACGTPVITFATGGSMEMLDDTCGCVVPKNDVDTLKKKIVEVCVNKPFSSDDCINKSKSFSADDKFEEYINLYE